MFLAVTRRGAGERWKTARAVGRSGQGCGRRERQEEDGALEAKGGNLTADGWP